MRISEKDAAALYREMTRQTGGPECLDEDLVARAGRGDLTGAERRAIAAHIAGCSDCTRAYQIARSMAPFAADARAALRPPKQASYWLAVAAAVLVAIMIPALAWLAILQQRSEAMIDQLRRQVSSQEQTERKVASAETIARLKKPQIGVPITDLDADVTRSASAAAPAILVPPTTEEFTLILHLPHQVGSTSTDMEIIDAAQSSLWRQRLLVAPRSSSITVTLHRSLVPSGSYTIRVAGTAFRFTVTYQ
jgi:hypothetical protein